MADPTQVVNTTTTIPDYARPYVEQMLGMTGGALYNYEYQDANGKIVPQGTPGSTMVYRDASGAIVPAGTPGAQPAPLGLKPYEKYTGERTAAFNDLQTNKLGTGAFDQAAKLGYNQYSTNAATGLQGLAQKAGNISYAPSSFDYTKVAAPSLQNYQMTGPANVAAQNVSAGTINAAQMSGADKVATKSFTDKGTAASYMSPYTENVLDLQNKELERQAGIASAQRGAQAAKAGAFGGSRQGIENAEANRNLAMMKNANAAQGLQTAFSQAQQQFNAEQGYGLQGQIANQQAGLTVGGQNLSAEQQARVQNEANKLQASGMNAQQAMQAALANQQMGYNVGSQNLQANLGVQQLGSGQQIQAALANQNANQQMQQLAEQSKQFGAGLGLQGLQAGMQGYQNLGNIGQNLYGQNISNINTQAQLGGQQQQQAQNILDQKYQDFIAQKQEPFQQLSYMSNMLRGVPLSQGAQTVYQQPPSMLSQVAGAGLTLAGMSNLFGGKSNAKGGSIKEKKRKPAGLPALVLSKMG